MFKITEMELEFISDINMYLFIEKGMIRGISYIAKRFGKANNKYMESYDIGKPCKYIMHLDANNFYGWAVSQYLPDSEFKWLNPKEIDKFRLDLISENSSNRYILEVDLSYSDVPEQLAINHCMLSKYCSSIRNKYNTKTGGVNKLVPNLGNKSKYTLP